MLKSKGLWYLMMLGAVAGWVVSIAGLVKPFENEKMKKLWRGTLLTWSLGHPLELLFAIPIARSAGVPFLKAVYKTMVFGVTWWLPLYLKVFKK